MEITEMTISNYQLDGIKSITSFYDNIADNLLNIRGVRRYNPSRIYVADNMYTEFERIYTKQGVDKVGFAMAWLNIGPKTDSALEDNQVRIEKGFIEDGKNRDGKN